MAWEQSRNAAARWAMVGIVLGLLIGVITYAPATWLASAIASASGQRVMLADARGTVWSGSAVAVLTGGPGSQDASSLPGRLEWSLRFRGLGLELRARHACCLNDTVSLHIKPGLGRVTVTLAPKPDWIGQWPGAFLSGLGTPWNTLRLGGTLRLQSSGLKLDLVQGRWIVDGQADIDMLDASSRVSTLEPLGSYRFSLVGSASGTSQLRLSTLSGALQLKGEGTAGPSGVRFRGEARAATETDEAALNNLLNIIGRRNGAVSVISIG
ncbi:MAG: type II secretion system protein N [Rhizobacter sp.]|nr:type II secretion system protein N [Rhizobacter sp.]